MTDSVFREIMLQLENAFRVRPLSKASLKIYHEYLSDISDKELQAEASMIIKYDTFFPTIARLRKAGGHNGVVL